MWKYDEAGVVPAPQSLASPKPPPQPAGAEWGWGNAATIAKAAKVPGLSGQPAPPPPSLGVPGYEPDWKSLISGDPNVVAGNSDLERWMATLTDQKRSAVRRAIIEAGFQLGSGVSGDVDQATLDEAGANRWSTAAQLALQKTRAGEDARATLAGRGILDSGAFTAGNQRIQDRYEQATSQGVQALLDKLAGYEGDYSKSAADANYQRGQLREAAAQRVQSDPRYRESGSAQALLDPISGLYKTSDGRWYDKDGNRVAAPAPGGGAAGPPVTFAPSQEIGFSSSSPYGW